MFSDDNTVFLDATTQPGREAGNARPPFALVRQYLAALADAYELPAPLVHAVEQTASHFDTQKLRANSSANLDFFAPDDQAYGVMQVRGDQIGKTVRGPDGSSYRISDNIKHDWRANVQAGVALLAQQYQLANLENPFGSEREHAQQAYAGYSSGAPFRDRYLQTLPYNELPAHPGDRAFLKNFLHAYSSEDQQDQRAPQGPRTMEYRLRKDQAFAETMPYRPDADASADSNDSRVMLLSQRPAASTTQQKQNQRATAQAGADTQKKISAIAQKYSDASSTAWAFDAKKDDFPANSNKCNKFVYDVIKETGAKALYTTREGVSRPPRAEDWADQRTKIPGWRVLKPGESPQPGDVAAYKLPGYHPGYSGHSGIVTSVDPNGVVHAAAAHNDAVGPDNKFQPPRNRDDRQVVYRRYVGP